MNAAAAQSLNLDWNNFWTRGGDNRAGDVCITIDGKPYSVYQLLSLKSSTVGAGSYGDALAPMFVPTDDKGNLYKIPNAYLNNSNKPCGNACAGLAFTLTGIINTVKPDDNTPVSKNFTYPTVCATTDNCTIKPLGNNAKSIVPNNGTNIYSICPVDTNGKQAKDDKGKPFACGCTIKDSSSSAQYTELGTSENTNSTNWQTQPSSNLRSLMAESTPQTDVKHLLSDWPPQSGIASTMLAGWLARFVRTFYYLKLNIMSTCYWGGNDLVYAELKNVTNAKGDSVANMEGFMWLTANDAKAGVMDRFTRDTKGNQHLDQNGPYKFDPINVYQITPQGSGELEAAIEGLGGAGDELSISGVFGICNDRTYQFGQFTQRIGIYIAIGIAVIALLFVLLDHGIGSAHGASFENPMMVAASSGGKEESSGGEAEAEEI